MARLGEAFWAELKAAGLGGEAAVYAPETGAVEFSEHVDEVTRDRIRALIAAHDPDAPGNDPAENRGRHLYDADPLLRATVAWLAERLNIPPGVVRAGILAKLRDEAGR